MILRDKSVSALERVSQTVPNNVSTAMILSIPQRLTRQAATVLLFRAGYLLLGNYGQQDIGRMVFVVIDGLLR